MEIWKPIKDYEGFYEVSNFGRVRSLDREVEGKNGTVYTYQGKVLRQRLSAKKDCLVNLSKEGTQTTFMVRSLVAQAFLEPPKRVDDVLQYHDQNPWNNHAKNIYYIPLSQLRTNMKHQETMPANQKVQMVSPTSKRVLKTFDSIKDAYRYLGKAPNANIHFALKGVYKTAYGYCWKKV